jgi:hypothetical protein
VPSQLEIVSSFIVVIVVIILDDIINDDGSGPLRAASVAR